MRSVSEAGVQAATERGRLHGAPRGRPSGAPASPLATFIVERLQRQGRSRQALAEQLGFSPSAFSRLLSGKARWSRVSWTALADALVLSDDELAPFFDLCAQLPVAGDAGQSSAQSRTAGSPGRRGAGRPAHRAVSPLGRLIEPLLRERGMTRSALAQALGVQASTVTRLMSGAHASSYAISPQGVSAALGLEGVTRRAFLEQALALGAFALVSGRSAPATLRYHAVDLARFDEQLRATQRTLDTGGASDALVRARDLYAYITQTPFPRSHKDAAIARIEAALLLGRAQEATLPWGTERTLPAVHTYNQIDREILSQFAPSQLAYYYTRVYERRAPLYRELEEYGESIRQFSLAIEVFMPHVNDLSLLVELYRNRAHVWAVQGKEREWRLDIERAAQLAARIGGAPGRRLAGFIQYSEAEGLKRLAEAAAPLDVARARRYAESAVRSFTLAREQTQGEAPSHHLLLDVSLAQSYLWLDPDEARRLAEAAQARAHGWYPSLLRKSELTIARARDMRRMRPHGV